MRNYGLAGTYSIVAIDEEHRQMGVAVQSHFFSVGSTVPWAESGVGVVATQSLVDVSYGPLGLALMKAGKTPLQALKALTAVDPGAQGRQVAILDVNGNVAVQTGKDCIPEAGHTVGRGFSVQANLMRNRRVWPEMAKTFRRTTGPLANRLMAVLEAAEEAGGDIRGKQSAAMLIVNVRPSGKPWADRVLELRVEDNPEPLKELKRLINMHEAYAKSDAAENLLSHGRLSRARRLYAEASRLAPEIEEMKFWQAVSLLGSNRIEEAIPLFRSAFVVNSDWRRVLRSLPRTSAFSITPGRVKRVLQEIEG